MGQNVGKKFENNFKNSIPDDVLYYRLHDAPQSFTQTSNMRFSWKNPCDVFLFDSGILLPLELKTTKENYYTFEKEKNSNKTAKIHYHQIEGLKNFSKFKNCIPGFILNFRIEKEDYQEITYFIHINDFLKMINALDKKSFNLIDLLKYNPIKISCYKKRVNFVYDIKSFLEEIRKNIRN